MVGIKNFEMPHNCYDCELHNYHECDLTSEPIEDDYCWNGDSREKHCPLVEAIPKAEHEEQIKINNKLANENKQLRAYITMMQADYNARLKADMVAMLEEIQLEIEEIKIDLPFGFEPVSKTSAFYDGVSDSSKVIQQKINALKGEGGK